MKMKFLALVLMLNAASCAMAFEDSVNTQAYSLNYSSYFIVGDHVDFNDGQAAQELTWKISPKVNAGVPNEIAKSYSFGLGDFAFSANEGYVLKGLNVELGDLTFFRTATTFGGSGVNATFYYVISVDGGEAEWMQPSWMTRTEYGSDGYSFGTFSGTYNLIEGSFRTAAMSLRVRLDVTAGPGEAAFVGAIPDTRAKLTFQALPVPEPQTYALMLAGLAGVGFIARRRSSR
ncbi:PEP-CTERM sorting domain-containing protein [Roseateles cellulosilyticus]|uniref:PEP-CTERM sorting domain-containing protein n=1 Tax=Pelomonas cellulosilytica TaxID=2906762 RepID=A0ABS8XR27_9BURK|nr:PEP-CTERM sorting domain-containing protein [Pelomonas sp. P8]MCE4555184.1 PEP-CTERM sorting domain-containing protein [Pelomonas sp. P8]